MSGLLPATGPMAGPVGPLVSGAGPARCGCDPTYGQSCAWCDGTAADERELARASKWRDLGPRKTGRVT